VVVDLLDDHVVNSGVESTGDAEDIAPFAWGAAAFGAEISAWPAQISTKQSPPAFQNRSPLAAEDAR